jgi:hypothetical protein
MARKKDDIERRKKKCIAEYKTGAYTQRELAHRNKLSVGLVSKLTKGLEKENEQVVNIQVQARQAVERLDEQELTAVNEVTEKRIQALKIDNFLDKGVGLAAQKAVEILQSPDATMDDVAKFSKAQNDMRVGLGTQDKFSASAQVNINNTNAQQNNVQPSDILDAIKRKHAVS